MNKMIQRTKKNLKSKKGFTLIELIVVIVIVGILAAILIPRFSGFTDRANETDALVKAKQVATAMDALYAEENNSWTGDAIDKTKISDLSGVKESDDIALYIQADGGFVVTVDGKYSAGRKDGDSPVEAGYSGS
jgi:prepilin-type N-terminal cleavage/methylation domain-containing protein